MTRRINTEGESLLDALSAAIAELASCDDDKVELSVRAPGFDPADTGDVRLRLDVVAKASEEDSEEDTDDASESERDDSAPQFSQEELDEEADAAADFMEGLLDRMGLPGDIKIRVFDDHSEVEIVDVGSGALIGRRGQTLEAIQELVRCALQREFQRRTRVKIDVEGYRVRRLEKLLEKAEEAIEDVLDRGDSERLEPMDVFERKAVHQLVATHDGVTSRSQGREPGRRVIIELED
jgi:spoIIIJ-associated protein